ncbi:bifunctional (p)ppGpp synthetase/guanosine-3',5'-bis(diphosphate) 3'-pyrophosphohydrolase, partial [Candidatus Micrarchaeota archaeon]|nr:bifunctional (p)ppGpp synthetase/guanosine-3',5'-bis(diphosphate) 3'-pyrophosphohydrolase [Candidatus Micrarchaeota archaeon]
KEIANARAQIGKTHVLVRLISAARAKAELDYLNKLTERTAGQETRRGDVAYEIVNFHTPFLKSAGLYSAGSRLEDETFKITNPEEYDKIESQVGELSEHVESIKKEVKTDLRRLLKEAGFESSGLSNLQIEIRQKSIASIYRKMNEGGGQLKYPSVDRIHDLLGVRILFDRKKYDDETQGEENGEAKEKRRRLIYQRDSEACQKLFEMLQTMPGSNLGKFFVRRVVQKRAYDVNPKANNYRSRHAIFYGKDEQSKALTAIEAQIHTHDMQRKYDAGEASHEFYKKLQKLEEPEMHLCFMPVLKGLSFDAFRKTPRQ